MGKRNFTSSPSQNRTWSSHFIRLFSTDLNVKPFCAFVFNSKIILLRVIIQIKDCQVKSFAPFPLQKLHRYYDFIRHQSNASLFWPHGLSVCIVSIYIIGWFLQFRFQARIWVLLSLCRASTLAIYLLGYPNACPRIDWGTRVSNAIYVISTPRQQFIFIQLLYTYLKLSRCLAHPRTAGMPLSTLHSFSLSVQHLCR